MILALAEIGACLGVKAHGSLRREVFQRFPGRLGSVGNGYLAIEFHQGHFGQQFLIERYVEILLHRLLSVAFSEGMSVMKASGKWRPM